MLFYIKCDPLNLPEIKKKTPPLDGWINASYVMFFERNHAVLKFKLSDNVNEKKNATPLMFSMCINANLPDAELVECDLECVAIAAEAVWVAPGLGDVCDAVLLCDWGSTGESGILISAWSAMNKQ